MDTMEMDTGGLVAQVVLDVDNNGVANIGPDRGAGPLVVHTNDGAREAIRSCPNPVDRPVVGHDGGVGDDRQAAEAHRGEGGQTHCD